MPARVAIVVLMRKLLETANALLKADRLWEKKCPCARRILCMRYTQLEKLHAGLGPITRTGDYSDVLVVDADGRRIHWTEISRIDEDEMRALKQEIVNRLSTFHLEPDDPKLQATIERWMGAATRWDEPSLDHRMLSPEVRK